MSMEQPKSYEPSGEEIKKAEETEKQIQEQDRYIYEVSVEHSQKLINAKNALKEVVENISRDDLKKISDSVTFDFIEGCNGDVNRYVYLKTEFYKKQGNLDWGVFHIAEELDGIRERLKDSR